ncbi:hypothetical protein ACOCJ7_11590 [Knoellia sp. CPCC 206453]|uniref:hypothetical protein n=1 Tax=Knoellia pratensis TaxID=3404796 RepID=UPI00361525BE
MTSSSTAQKPFRLGKRAALSLVLVLALAGACVPLFLQPGPDGLIGGAAVFLVLLVLGSYLVLSRHKLRAAGTG